MRSTLNNMVVILTVASVSLAGSAALAKGGNNGSRNSSGGSFKAFSGKSMPAMSLSSGNGLGTPKSFNKVQSGKLLSSQIGSSLNSNSGKSKILQGNVLQGNNNGNKLPKLIDQGISKGKGSKILDSKMAKVPDRKGVLDGLKKNKDNKGNFCKDKCKNKCFDNFCWPWFSCHNHCYDPCYDPCYDSCYYGCFTPYYTTTVVEVPVVVEQPVIVGQPAVGQATLPLAGAEQPNAEQQGAAPVEAATESQAEAPATDLMQVPVGATITLRGEAFGEKSGRVAMRVGELLLGSKVTKWEDKAVTITLPQVGLAAAANGKFLILKADGTLATEVPFQLVPPQAPAVSQQ